MLFQLLFGSGRMQTYTVHEGPSRPTDRIDRAEALAFVKDGFSLQAFLLGALWLLMQRLWLGLGLYVAAVVSILSANAWLGLPAMSTLIALIGLHVIVGFEADTIERLGLEQKGWQSLGSVSGTSALDCERRFFDTWLHTQPVLAPSKSPVLNTPTTANPRAPTSATARGAVAQRLATLWTRAR